MIYEQKIAMVKYKFFSPLQITAHSIGKCNCSNQMFDYLNTGLQIQKVDLPIFLAQDLILFFNFFLGNS